MSSVWPALPTRAAFPACFTASNFCFLPLRACLLPQPLDAYWPRPPPSPPARQRRRNQTTANGRAPSGPPAGATQVKQAGERNGCAATGSPSSVWCTARGQTLVQEQLRPGHQVTPLPINLHYASAGHDGTRASLTAGPPRKRAQAIHQPKRRSRQPGSPHTRRPIRSPRGLAFLAAPVASIVATGPEGSRVARVVTGDQGQAAAATSWPAPRSQGHRAGTEEGWPAEAPACSVRLSCVKALGHPLAVRPRQHITC